MKILERTIFFFKQNRVFPKKGPLLQQFITQEYCQDLGKAQMQL